MGGLKGSTGKCIQSSSPAGIQPGSTRVQLQGLRDTHPPTKSCNLIPQFPEETGMLQTRNIRGRICSATELSPIGWIWGVSARAGEAAKPIWILTGLFGFLFERSLSLSGAAWERLQVVFAQQCANPAPCLLNASSRGGSRHRHHKHRQAFVAALKRAKQTNNRAPAAAENTHLGIRDRRELLRWIIRVPAPARWQ